VRGAFPEFGEHKLGNHSGQIWAFVLAMKPGDLVAVPRKTTPAIAFGEITGAYHHEPAADGRYQHSRSVCWLNLEVPRSTIDQDLLYSFGAIMTICEVRRNKAEERIRKMVFAGFNSGSKPKPTGQGEAAGENGIIEEVRLDLEELARDQIAKHINAKVKGHGLARLVEAIPPDSGLLHISEPGRTGRRCGHPRFCWTSRIRPTAHMCPSEIL